MNNFPQFLSLLAKTHLVNTLLKPFALICTILIAILSPGCSNNAEIEEKVKAELANRDAEMALEKDRVQRENDLNTINSKIRLYNTEIQVQRTNLEDLKRPRLLRTRKEKEDQLRAVMNYINKLEGDVQQLQQIAFSITNNTPYTMPVFKENKSDK